MSFTDASIHDIACSNAEMNDLDFADANVTDMKRFKVKIDCSGFH